MAKKKKKEKHLDEILKDSLLYKMLNSDEPEEVLSDYRKKFKLAIGNLSKSKRSFDEEE